MVREVPRGSEENCTCRWLDMQKARSVDLRIREKLRKRFPRRVFIRPAGGVSERRFRNTPLVDGVEDEDSQQKAVPRSRLSGRDGFVIHVTDTAVATGPHSLRASTPPSLSADEDLPVKATEDKKMKRAAVMVADQASSHGEKDRLAMGRFAAFVSQVSDSNPGAPGKTGACQ